MPLSFWLQPWRKPLPSTWQKPLPLNMTKAPTPQHDKSLCTSTWQKAPAPQHDKKPLHLNMTKASDPQHDNSACPSTWQKPMHLNMTIAPDPKYSKAHEPKHGKPKHAIKCDLKHYLLMIKLLPRSRHVDGRSLSTNQNCRQVGP